MLMCNSIDLIRHIGLLQYWLGLKNVCIWFWFPTDPVNLCFFIKKLKKKKKKPTKNINTADNMLGVSIAAVKKKSYLSLTATGKIK